MAFPMRSLAGVFGALFLSALVAVVAPAQAQDGNAPLSELLVEGPLGDVWMGDENAPVTVIEYAALTCSHCANFHNNIYDSFKEKYIDTGLVRFTIREMPIDLSQGSILGTAAFMLARCAPGENGYYAMIDLLFEQQVTWLVEEAYAPLLQLAQQAGFSEEGFTACLGPDSQPMQEAIFWVYDRGGELGVNATPTFFIDGDKYAGVLTLQQLDDIIAAKL